jgi:hypothetical protein
VSCTYSVRNRPLLAWQGAGESGDARSPGELVVLQFLVFHLVVLAL